MENLELVYATDYFKVQVKKEVSYIELTWLQQPSSAIFRQEIERTTDYAIANNYTKALLDVRQRPYLELGDQTWLIREIMPRFIAGSLRFAYLVNPLTLETLDVFGIQDKIAQNPKLKKCIQIEVFLRKEDAQRWLFSQ